MGAGEPAYKSTHSNTAYSRPRRPIVIVRANPIGLRRAIGKYWIPLLLITLFIGFLAVGPSFVPEPILPKIADWTRSIGQQLQSEQSEPSGSLPTDSSQGELSLDLLRDTSVVDGRATTSSFSDEDVREWRLIMLGLINTDRVSNGLAPVTLGENPAAQVHAEEMLEHGYLGHWGLDGMKPYMRYTLAGGVGSEGENVSARTEPLERGVNYLTRSPRASLIVAEAGLMNSPGHRRNILDPLHQKVNLGIACDEFGCAVVQQFEENYIAFDRLPEISNGRLVFSGNMFGGFEYYSAQVWYDPLPQQLTTNQIRGTYSYCRGRPVMFVREPAEPGYSYSTDSAQFSWPTCLNPEDLAPGANKERDTRKLADTNGVVRWKDASRHDVRGASFDIEVPIDGTVSVFGRGVYTIQIWGVRDGSPAALSNYSIFVAD